MKDRAKSFGETAVFDLLRQIQQTKAQAKVHLMGHSFGCIVVSATLAGPQGTGSLVRPIDSFALMQGALSLWSYCADIPFAKGRPVSFDRSLMKKSFRTDHHIFLHFRHRGWPLLSTRRRRTRRCGFCAGTISEVRRGR